MEIEQQSRRETEYQYKEIYEKQGYLRLGARLGKAGCVVDVGANIGMFALFASQWCPEGRVYALEPVEEVYEQLRKNAERYGGNRIQVYPYGLGEREEKKEFTYYRRNSMLSGVREYADEGEERELLRKFVERERAAAAAEGGGVEEGEGVQEEEVEELLGRQLESEVRVCRVRRLSDVMREEGLERIDLLKIDVQRAELDVLRGIEEEDWGKIGQIIMEVHDDGKKEKGGGGLAGVVEMLRRHGFREVVEQEESLAGTDRYNVYAVQKEKEEEIRGEGRGYGVKLEEVREEGGTRAEGTGIGGRGRITVEELQRYLGKRLPEYMVPGEMMVLEEMPLTANGKIDRQGMPAPGGRGKGEGEERGPRTPVEEVVAGIWSEVLKREELVSVEASFFELGGHSLLATQVMSRVRAALGVEIELAALFEAPTVRGLAEKIEQRQREEQGLVAPALQREEQSGVQPLSFAQQRLWFLDQLHPHSPLYNSSYPLRVRGQLNFEALRKSMAILIERHESLRTRFEVLNGEPVQIIEKGLTLALDMH